MIGHMVSLFDVSQALLVSGDLLVWCSLAGPPVVKITHANGDCGAWPGWVVSASVLLLAIRGCFLGSTPVDEKEWGLDRAEGKQRCDTDSTEASANPMDGFEDQMTFKLS